jgi:retron-type reverse transcriptase
MKRHNNLFEKITHIDNLRDAYRKTSAGKRTTQGFLEFKEFADVNLRQIQEQLLDKSWTQGPYRQFIVYEPKPRLISALDFSDRIVQHAVVNIIGPIFDRGLLPYTFACRKGMGTHAGVKHIQSLLRKTEATHFLKTDYSKFFPSVNLTILHDMIQRKIKCKATNELIECMLPASGYGLPIGGLISQLFANVYASSVDRRIHFVLGAKYWARYMDDIVILSSDKSKLKKWFDDIEEFSQKKLELKMSKWQISSTTRGINFLGYRIWPKHKLLRKDSVLRA